MTRTYKPGRSTSGYDKGEPITRLDQINPGDTILIVSHKFQAENLARVQSVNRTPTSEHPSVGFTARYIIPDVIPEFQLDGPPFFTHDFFLTDTKTEEFFAATRQNA